MAKIWHIIFFFFFCVVNVKAEFEDQLSDLYRIEGKVFSPDAYLLHANWQANTRVIVNGGEYLGFLRDDGTFVVNNVPSGTYVIEIANSNVMYEMARVDINSKGKFRARKVNFLQVGQVQPLPYPLKLKPLGNYHYFQVREVWKVTDVLFNPMVMFMVLPLVLIMILPKMLNDPETKKEMEQFQMPKYEIPEVSEMITTFFSGGEPKPQQKKIVKAPKKRQ